MNTKHHEWRLATHTLLMISILLMSIGCKKDEEIPTPNPGPENGLEIGEGLTADDFEKFPGEVGLILNAREIAKKGYIPTQAIVTITATHGDYSETIDLDAAAFMGQVSISLEGLTDAAVTELQEGVPVRVKVQD